MKIVTVLSMLHEDAAVNSATRYFAGQPVLAWTLARLAQVHGTSDTLVLCTAAQQRLVAPFARTVVVDQVAPVVEAIRVARTWCEGWRGGLLMSSDFDLGYDPEQMLRLVKETGADAILLVNPASAVVDPYLLQAAIDRLEHQPQLEIAFVHGAPGSGGAALRKELVERLAQVNAHPGVTLSYRPTSPMRDPIGSEACVEAPLRVARTTHSLKADTTGRIAALETALNDKTPLEADLAELIGRLTSGLAPTLRDLTVELTTRRATSPCWYPSQLDLAHHDADSQRLAQLWQELQGAGTRVTLAGVGDPILHPEFPAIGRAVAAAGLPLHVETDLVEATPEVLETLASGAVQVLSIILPAGTAPTYAKVMGLDAMEQVGRHLQKLIELRSGRNSLVPLVCPIFYKLRDNLAEMESWYDHWLNTFASAVIRSPSDAADMTPARRRPCQRLQRRLTVLSSGAIVPCEEDIRGTMKLGQVGNEDIQETFKGTLDCLRQSHEHQELGDKLCCGCKQWHRP